MKESLDCNAQAERIVILLGWDLDAFWASVDGASRVVLENVEKILDVPDDPKAPDWTKERGEHGLKYVRRRLATLS